MQKRLAFKLVFAGAALAALTACGQKEEPKAPAAATPAAI